MENLDTTPGTAFKDHQLLESDKKVSKAVADIRRATDRSGWIDLGTDETLLNGSLSALNPVERKQAEAMFHEKYGVTLRAEINEQESGWQRALSLSVLDWPNADTIKAHEFWTNWERCKSSDSVIPMLAAMTSDEICILEQAYRNSYCGKDLFAEIGVSVFFDAETRGELFSLRAA